MLFCSRQTFYCKKIFAFCNLRYQNLAYLVCPYMDSTCFFLFPIDKSCKADGFSPSWQLKMLFRSKVGDFSFPEQRPFRSHCASEARINVSAHAATRIRKREEVNHFPLASTLEKAICVQQHIFLLYVAYCAFLPLIHIQRKVIELDFLTTVLFLRRLTVISLI